ESKPTSNARRSDIDRFPAHRKPRAAPELLARVRTFPCNPFHHFGTTFGTGRRRCHEKPSFLQTGCCRGLRARHFRGELLQQVPVDQLEFGLCGKCFCIFSEKTGSHEEATIGLARSDHTPLLTNRTYTDLLRLPVLA